jgi:HPt (histidine-containing phosphotransfer) domain-containing protein
MRAQVACRPRAARLGNVWPTALIIILGVTAIWFFWAHTADEHDAAAYSCTVWGAGLFATLTLATIVRLLSANRQRALNEPRNSKPLDPVKKKQTPGKADAYAIADFDAILDGCGGEISSISEILEKFKTRSANDLLRIEQSLAAADADGVRRAARSLGGVACSVAAESLCGVANRIEQSGVDADLSSVEPALNQARHEVQKCIASIAEKLPFNPTFK